MAKLQPPNWEPPYKAYVSEIADALTMSLAAVQSSDRAEGQEAVTTLEGLLRDAPGLLHSEQVFFEDEQGCRNDVVISYWSEAGDVGHWRDRADVQAFFSRQRKQVGLWLESMSAPRERFEISNSTLRMDWGVSRHHPTREDPVHGYYGAMRDRIAAAEDGGLASPVGRLGRARRADTLGRHLSLSLPGNLCFIRTVQGWLDCSDEERDYFLQNTFPVYEAGVAFLQGHPLETNCIGARLVRDLAESPSLPQTETLAWFLSLSDLENWVWNHPTHAAIFNAMGDHAARFKGEISVLLGHEVLVIPKGALRAEYHNCHNGTGFLRFFDAEEIR